jgi:cysteinyl-tRNA synthetase
MKEKEHVSYRQEMRNFVQAISSYAKGMDTSFIMIPQNGHQLLYSGEVSDGSTTADVNYINAIDGVGREDLFYGFEEDDQPTPSAERDEMLQYMLVAKNNGLKVLVTDYCVTPYNVTDSYSQSDARGFISFAADHRDLDNIPASPSVPHNVNIDTIAALADAKNFLYLINPESYPSKDDFLNTLRQTNYDVIIMDLFFSGQSLTLADISSLKPKQNGGFRKVVCYLSIGEAENYRYYWQSFWSTNPPSFIVAENPSWQGNYKVKYWDKQWHSIMYGNNNSYLKKIMDAGFDGVYLDIIDAFEYFEKE